MTEPARVARGASRAASVLRERADFEQLLRAGARVSSRNFVARAAPNNGPHARLGIIAGRKAARRAVDRNRAKRLIREVFVDAATQLGSCDVAIQLKNDLRGMTNQGVREELARLIDTLLRRVT